MAHVSWASLCIGHFSKIPIIFCINTIIKLQQSDQLFDYNFQNASSLEIFFVEFIYNDNYDIETKEENIKIKNEKKEDDKEYKKGKK